MLIDVLLIFDKIIHVPYSPSSVPAFSFHLLVLLLVLMRERRESLPR